MNATARIHSKYHSLQHSTGSLASSLQVMVKANNYKQIWSMELTKKACTDKNAIIDWVWKCSNAKLFMNLAFTRFQEIKLTKFSILTFENLFN